MSKFAETGKTVGDILYRIHHINEDGSMCGDIYVNHKYTAVNWQADGSARNGATNLDIKPINQAAELLQRMASTVSRVGGGGGSGSSLGIGGGGPSITTYVSVPENVYDEIYKYLRTRRDSDE